MSSSKTPFKPTSHTPPSLSRRVLMQRMAGVAAASPLPLAFGQSAEFSYKYAHNLPPTHAAHVRLTEAAQAIRADTDGRVDIQVFPASQLGSDTDTLSQLRAGGVEFFNLSGLILATLIPQVTISALGFAFKDYDAVWHAMDGELGAYIRGQIARVGLLGLERPFDIGFRQITTATKPIRTPEDLQGLKIRVPISPMSTSLFKGFGAAPVGINIVELYTALQTGTVDGQENPLTVITAFKFEEVQKYCAITNHMWNGQWCLVNRRAWERLPAPIRDVVAAHINQAALRERADLTVQNAGARATLEAAGVVFNDTDANAFRQTLNNSGFYAEWKEKIGTEGWAVLERSTGTKLG